MPHTSPVEDLFQENPITPSENIRPINLHEIPRENWDTILHLPVAFPPDIQAYLRAGDGPTTRLTTIEVDAIEDAMDHFYAVSSPYTILISQGTPALVRL